jgi:hypothetical protein
MSDRPCNLCDFQRRKREGRQRGVKVSMKLEPIVEGKENWVRVYENGKPIDVWYQVLSKECAC